MPRVNVGKRDQWQELVRSVSDDDGLRTREAGDWTADKLWFWHRYVNIAAKAMVGKPGWEGGVFYVDLFAGPGVCTLRDSGTRIPGSPLIAAHAPKPFTRILLAELDPNAAAACRVRMDKTDAASSYRLFEGDCNTRIAEIARDIPRRALTLVFADPSGLDIDYETVASLSRRGNVDLLILLADAMDAVRNLAHYMEPGSKMDRFLGPDSGWRERLKGLRGAALRQALRSLYEKQLRRLGYQHFAHKTIRGERGPLYKLVFASKHELGLDFWHKAARKHRSGQQDLFDF